MMALEIIIGKIGSKIQGIQIYNAAGFERDFTTLDVTISKNKDINFNMLIFKMLEKFPLLQKLIYILK